MIRTLVIFGASGDLTSRFLLPGLAQLAADGTLPENFTVVGSARTDWDDHDFRSHGQAALEQHAGDIPEAVRNALMQRLHFRPVDVTDETSVADVMSAAADLGPGGPMVAYLALPTGLISSAVSGLGSAGFAPGGRIAVEKPFGEDEHSARDLNALLTEVTGGAGGEPVFRVDHALGMHTVQNLLPLRFANRFPGAMWNSEHISEIEVLWEETLALEGRASFYDRAGALKDVMQNHMMQVLSVAAMEPPEGADDGSYDSVSSEELRRRKTELLDAIRELSPEDVVATSRRARYTAGRLADSGGADGGMVPDYAAESGVDPARNTETFAEVVLTVDNPRWSGTRFRMRAGKALAQRRKGLRVHFHADEGRQGQQLWIGIDGPNEISLSVITGLRSEATDPVPIALDGAQPESSLSPYARVLRDLLSGGSSLSVGSREAELAWAILAPVREAWDQDRVPMQEYPAGTAGPSPRAPS